jgi:DNA-binding NarL/FixJ family response regulator
MITETYRILLIEDNPGDAVWIQEQLAYTRGIRYIVEHRNDLQKGFTYLENASCDVVLLDLGLPDSTGISTVDKFVQRFPDLPVIVLTGTEDMEIGALSVKKGVLDYLVKGYVGNSILAKAILFSIERKKLMDSLAAANKHWQHVFDILPDPIIMLTPDLHMQKVNKTFANIFAMNNTECTGMLVSDCLNGFSFAGLMDFLQPFSFEYHQPGAVKIWTVYVSPVMYETGNPQGFVVIFK